ncbi:MAG: Chromosomal replication initiator protein DnaA [Thermodesulfobacteriota bacterium]|nr:Chromosomal replication initiator protein DnaA [Thermodesulfobacteriota bacterium]
MTEKNKIWDQIKSGFKTGLPSAEFKTWLSRASLKEISARQAVIEVPNKFIAHWLQENYADQIQTLFKDHLQTVPEVVFTCADPSDKIETQTGEDVKDRDLRPAHGIDTLTTFADFVTANSNRLAYTSALSVANRPASDYNPLYIYSAFSLGKTHILNGIGNLVLQNHPTANIMYRSADQFLSEFSSTTDSQEPNRFWEREEGPDFFLLDDIHLLAGNRKVQTELLALCSSFLDSSRQLVVAAACPPAKIRNLLPQLRSRLEWGLIAEIHPPGQRTKVKIIKKMAKDEKLVLPDDVAFFLANTADDMNTLLEHIRRLKSHFFSHKTPIEISTAELMVKLAHPSNRIDINHIQDITAKYFNISVEDMLSSKRERPFSYPRQVAMYLSKKLTPASLKQIGSAFGNKHHSTIIYAQNRIQQDKAKNERISKDIDKIQKLLF